MLTQQEFSELALQYITQHHAEFLPTVRNMENGSFDCTFKSPQGKLSLYIATYNREITIGFVDDTEFTDWHTHMSVWGCNEPEEELAMMTTIIHKITSGREPVVYGPESGYSLRDNIDPNETVYRWSDL